jgi:hypothetical protein
LTEEEIDQLLDKFITKYLKLAGPLSKRARDEAIDSWAVHLRDSSAGEFSSADEFADALFERLKDSYDTFFNSQRAKTIVKRATEQIYKFYRLQDTTPFAGESPVKLRFGGPDTRAVRFFNKLDNFYFSTFVDNRREEIKTFLRDEYLEKGAALFGRGTKEELNDFRRAAGGKLDRLNDRAVDTIVVSSVQRVRNYAHINSLRQAKFKLAKIVAILDTRTSEICQHLDGKLIRVGVAAETIDRLTELEPGDYAKELYKSESGRAFASDPVNYVKDRISDEGVVDDDLVAEGRGFPPLHVRCRSRVEAVFQ